MVTLPNSSVAEWYRYRMVALRNDIIAEWLRCRIVSLPNGSLPNCIVAEVFCRIHYNHFKTKYGNKFLKRTAGINVAKKVALVACVENKDFAALKRRQN